MDDGTEMIANPGDITSLPSGRDAWAVGDERNGNWTLMRRSLGCRSFGVNLVEFPARASIPELDEIARDQEELPFVVSGSPTRVIDGEDHPAPAGTFAWVDPLHRRVVHNDSSKPASVLIVSAPRTSGCTPMGWA